MQLYSCGCGTPEGTDFEILLQHEKVFTREEFHEMCEEAFCYTLEWQYETVGYTSLSSYTEKVIEYLKLKGFIDPPPVIGYYIEPYWGKDRIKSKKLLELIDKPTDEERVRKYIEGLKIEEKKLEKD